MPRPPLAPGVNLYMDAATPDDWTWAAAGPLLRPGTRVRALGAAEPVYELQPDGAWRDTTHADIQPIGYPQERASVIVALGEGGELVALPRPPLPEALAVPDDPVEVQVRDALVEAGARSIELLVADVRANPSRALRRLRVIERVSHVLREGVAELGLDDEDEAGDDLGDGGMLPMRARRRRRPGFAGGHAYGAGADQQTMLNGAVRAQHMQALVQTIERTGPNGTAPNAAVFEAATRELRLLFPDAEPPRAPAEAAGEPPAPVGATIAAPLDGAPA